MVDRRKFLRSAPLVAAALAVPGVASAQDTSESRSTDELIYGLTAILKTQKGKEDIMEQALHDIIAYVSDNEPGTIEYYFTQSIHDPTIFTTYERYISQEAMDAHNNSDATAAFYDTINPTLDGEVILVEGKELGAKQVEKSES